MYNYSHQLRAAMSLEEFEGQSRVTIERTLNRLHTATLLAGQLEAQIAETGREIQQLSRLIEAFVAQQRQASP